MSNPTASPLASTPASPPANPAAIPANLRAALDKAPQGNLQRAFTVQRDAVNKATRTATLAFASELPYERYWGVEILDVPSAAAEVCSEAYRRYGARRRSQSGLATAAVPLPDFFIGAHAEVMGWDIATAARDRFRTYFPSVRLRTP